MSIKRFALCLPLVGVLTAAEIPTDSTADWRLNAADKREQTIKTVDYSPEIGKVQEITLKPSVFSYIEFSLKKPLVIAANAEELKDVTFSLDLFAEPSDTVRLAAVRLLDATGETFQFSSVAKLRPGTWSTITIPLKNPVSAWGGNKDRKIDFPVSFSAITVDCTKETGGDVRLLVDHLSWTRK